MSKVICDVCGTTYPETASSCPICGCAMKKPAQTAAGGPDEQTGSYTYVKGGRFSKSNVRKRNKKAKEARPAEERKNEEGANVGLVIVVLVLLLAIVAVLVYIGARVLFPAESPLPNTPNSGQQSGNQNSQQSSSTLDESGEKPCTKLEMLKTIVLSVGDNLLLNVQKTPTDTTDMVMYVSENPAVATVDENGLIVAVSDGETVIYVTCGNQSAQCTVICGAGNQETTVPPVTVPDGYVLKLNCNKDLDFTLNESCTKWNLFKKNDYGVTASDITWTADDPSIATVENGLVKAVKRGYTTIRASFGDQTISCIVRVAFDPKSDSAYRLSDADGDVTIAVGDFVDLSVVRKDNSAKVQGIEWTASEEGYVLINGTKITAEQVTPAGGIKVTTTYEGETFTCIIRVKEPEREENN